MPTKYENNRLKTGLASAAVLCVGGALTAMTAMSAPSVAAPGNNGTVKVSPTETSTHRPTTTRTSAAPSSSSGTASTPTSPRRSRFDEQAPTTGVGMTVAGPRDVFVDDDPATGAGTAGFDGAQVYTLSLHGAPHPQQGYHVKLTIDTPESNGASVKHKVFWVEGCGPTTTPPPPPPPDHDPPTTRRRPRRRRPRRRRPRPADLDAADHPADHDAADHDAADHDAADHDAADHDAADHEPHSGDEPGAGDA